MASLNKILLLGNLTRDPELRYAGSGTAICGFGLAVNSSYGGEDKKEEVLFIDVTAFGRQAETASEYLVKGRPVLVEGRLQLRSWETQDGQKRTKHSVIAERIEFLPHQGGEARERRPPATAPQTRGGGPPEEAWQAPDSSDDDIPF